jgi:TolB protein
LTGLNDPAALEVIDFAAAPDGERVAYSVLSNGGGSAIRQIEIDGGRDALLLDCPAAECAAPVWSPDGRLVYERRELAGGVPDSPRLHRLDPATGATTPLIAADTPTYGARFSPDGAWLSYVSPGDEGIVLYRLADGRQRLLAGRAGSPAAFSPDGATVVYGDLAFGGDGTAEGETAAVYLYRAATAETGERERLSPEGNVADSAPSFSPDGEWIAFLRAPAETGAARQLWLMRADGSAARALTDDPAITHGPPNWSPDGRTLLFQRFDLADPAARPAVWRLDVETGAETLVAEDGYLPAWVR